MTRAAVPPPIPAEWLWGWDPTPGIVSVWAQPNGIAHVWRRSPETGELVREQARFRPWMLLDRLDELVDDVLRRRHVGVTHAEIDDVHTIGAQPRLDRVDMRKDVGRQAADAVKIVVHDRPL